MGSGESWLDPGSCSSPSFRQCSPNPTPSPSRSQCHAPCTAALPLPPAPQSPLVMLQRLPAMCSQVPGFRTGCVPPTLPSLPVVLQSSAMGLGRGGCEHHRRRGEAAAGPARTSPSSHSEEHPRPSPEQLHIPPGALGRAEVSVGHDAMEGSNIFFKMEKKINAFLIYYLNVYNPDNELIGCKTAHRQHQGTALLIRVSPPCSALSAAE